MYNLIYDPGKYLLAAILLILTFQSCKKDEVITPEPPIVYEQGEINKISSLGIFSVSDIQQILDASGADLPFTLDHSVEALSVSYYTIDGQGGQIQASGAYFVPQGISDLPLLSVQHGTETKRNKVASVSPNNSTEGIIGLVTASMGYFTAVPDYPGFGISEMAHPYMHAPSLVPSVIDFMIACKHYCAARQISLNGQVFLSGYSEGGYLTLAAQKIIEEQYTDKFNLTAVAPLSGPYDLKGTIDSIFQNNYYSTPAYAAYFFTAYNNIYKWNRLSDFYKAEYASKMPELFDGSKSWGEVVNQLPDSFTELMHTSFINNYNSGNELLVNAALQENTILDWTPHAPLHFFHGEADKIVPLQNALTAIDRLSSKGGTDIQLTSIPGGTHESAGPAAISGAIEWFESFKTIDTDISLNDY